MSDFNNYIQEYILSLEADNSKTENSLAEIVSRIVNNDNKLIELITNLGPNLKNEDEISRYKAINCLSETLAKIPSDKLNATEVNHLVKFFITKFDEVLSFKHVLIGLNSLISMNSFSVTESSEYILTELNDHYNPKNFNASVRYLSLQIIKNIVNKEDAIDYFTNSVKLNKLFVKTFLNVATGEKDPRNLLLSFGLNEQVLKHFKNLEEFKEDLFDISFCYFPIAFKPPKNDPYKITTEDLKTALRNTLTANETTADDLLPSLFEKLTSTSISVKQDVLDTLESVVSKYSIESIEENWIQIWDSLKFELLHNELPYVPIVHRIRDSINGKKEMSTQWLSNDEKEKQDQVKAFSSQLLIFRLIAMKLSENENYLTEFVNKITDDLMENIKDYKNKLSKTSYLILSAIASSNEFCFNTIVKSIGVLLFKSNNLQNLTVDEQISIIEEISFFLNSYSNIYGTIDNHKNKNVVVEDKIDFFHYKDEILFVMSKSLVSSSDAYINLKTHALQNLKLLIELNGYLSEQEVRMILSYVIDIIVDYIKQKLSQEVSTTFRKLYPYSLNVLKSVARWNSNIISNELFSKLFSLLSDNIDDSSFDLLTSEKVVSILSDLSSNYTNLLEVFSIRLLSKLVMVVQKFHSTNDLENKDNWLNYSLLILNVLYRTIFNFSQKNPDFKTSNSFLRNYASMLLNLCFDISSSNVFYNDEIFELSSRILYLIVLKSDIKDHQPLLNDSVNIFINGQTDNLKILSVKNPIKKNIVEKPNKAIHLFLKLIAGVDFKSTELKGVELTKFISQITDQLNALPKKDIYERLGFLQLLFMVYNKWFTSQHDDFVETQFEYLTRKLTSNIVEHSEQTITSLEIYVWMAKALIFKNHKLSTKCSNFLLELINIAAKAPKGQEIGDKVCKSFGVIVDEGLIFKLNSVKPESPNSSSKMKMFLKKDKSNSNINVKSLYKQKLFEILIPNLIENFRSNNQNIEPDDDEKSMMLKKSFYLTTLCLVANGMNLEIILLKLEDFFPLLVESLKLPDKLVRSAALTTLKSLIINKTAKLISNYLSSLIPVLIQCFHSFNYFKKDFDGNLRKFKCNKSFIKNNSPEVRFKSLECLLNLAEVLNPIALMPFKTDILRNLVVPLDDKKRDVRKKACDCRQSYYDLGVVKS